MEVSAISYPDYYASRQVLRFPPPMRVHAGWPEGFDHAWKLLQYCFEIPDPATAIAQPLLMPPAEHALVVRFIAKATSLAKSPFLAHRTEISVQVSRSETGASDERIEKTFPHEESERGFLTLLRQFAHNDEEASFKKVQDVAARHVSEANRELVHRWGKYHKKLLARTPESWAYAKALPGRPMREIPMQGGPRVDQLLRTYFYGDVIHFGEGRDDLEVIDADAFTSANSRMTMYRGASALAMFYMGYATILDRIFVHDHRL